MTSASPAVDEAAFADALICALQDVDGVAAAALSSDDAGGWGLLRLELDPGADEVMVAATVGRLLREEYGLGVDTGAIALLEEARALATSGGVEIARMRLRSADRRVSASVTVRCGDREETAEASDTISGSGVLRALVEAAVGAMAQLAGGAFEVDVDAVEVSGADPRTARVTMTVDPDGQGRRLVGQSAVHEDVRQAVLRAALSVLGERARS
ncbi:MAG: hypothetical protein ACYDAQ_18660 [Mycobacteriales bacterium]